MRDITAIIVLNFSIIFLNRVDAVSYSGLFIMSMIDKQTHAESEKRCESSKKSWIAPSLVLIEKDDVQSGSGGNLEGWWSLDNILILIGEKVMTIRQYVQSSVILVCSVFSVQVFADVGLLFSSLSSKITAGTVAATFNITSAGSPSAQSTATELKIFSDSSCSITMGTINVSGSTTFNQNTTAYADAGSIYNIISNNSLSASSVHSMQISPLQATIPIFSPDSSCFVVSCSGGQCLGSSAFSVFLIDNPG